MRLRPKVTTVGVRFASDLFWPLLATQAPTHARRLRNSKTRTIRLERVGYKTVRTHKMVRTFYMTTYIW
jgi:hypothetical protein